MNGLDEVPLLMVSQVWIWSFEDYMVSMMSESKTPEMAHDQAPYAEAIIGVLLSHWIKKFGESSAGWTYQSPLDYFEIGVVKVLSGLTAYMRSQVSAKLDIRKEQQFIYDISDIRSELAMIAEVLSQQAEIIRTVIRDASMRWKGEASFSFVVRAEKQLEGYRERVTKIDKDAERIGQTIQDQLNLKRTHASMKEAHTTVVLDMAVIGFTTITIVFALIAFMTSRFALPIHNINKHQKPDEHGTNVYPTAYVEKWFSKFLRFEGVGCI